MPGSFVPGIPEFWGSGPDRPGSTVPVMKQELLRRTRDDIERLARAGLDWVTFSVEATERLRRAIPFDRSCWHMVDPGTVLFTGSLNQNVGCSGAWLAEHEYVVEDVNKWSFLARSGRRAGATGLATHGELARSARHRSQEAYGIGDELRGAFVVDGAYWGAAGFLRDRDRPWFTEDDVRFLASLSEPIAAGLPARALDRLGHDRGALATTAPASSCSTSTAHAESISPAAERWIAQMIEVPPPAAPADSKMVQAVAAQARTLRAGQDPLELAARSRVQTRSGQWLLLYGTRLAGGAGGRTAVIIQPAAPHEVAPLVALAYGLSERERQITRLCMKGQSTKDIAQTLGVSPYTVQDHLKSIFDKTGARSRGELVGQIFLEHYVAALGGPARLPGRMVREGHPVAGSRRRRSGVGRPVATARPGRRAWRGAGPAMGHRRASALRHGSRAAGRTVAKRAPGAAPRVERSPPVTGSWMTLVRRSRSELVSVGSTSSRLRQTNRVSRWRRSRCWSRPGLPDAGREAEVQPVGRPKCRRSDATVLARQRPPPDTSPSSLCAAATRRSPSPSAGRGRRKPADAPDQRIPTRGILPPKGAEELQIRRR